MTSSGSYNSLFLRNKTSEKLIAVYSSNSICLLNQLKNFRFKCLTSVPRPRVKHPPSNFHSPATTFPELRLLRRCQTVTSSEIFLLFAPKTSASESIRAKIEHLILKNVYHKHSIPSNNITPNRTADTFFFHTLLE